MQSVSRRNAIRKIGGLGTTFALSPAASARGYSVGTEVKIGIIADLHGGLASDAPQRLDAFLNSMKNESCDALVQLGDFAYPNHRHQEFADKFNSAHQHTLHVIGNHEFDHGLSRQDCFEAWNITSSYYSYDVGGLRVLVLDGNERGSPTHQGGYASYIGKRQQAWLDEQLLSSSRPTVILSHQPLAGTAAIDNATEVQSIIAKHRQKVLLCLNGHSHVDSLVHKSDIPYLHINSASYYWVGGKTRMAYYSTPLFTTLTIGASEVRIEPKRSEWRDDSPEKLGYFSNPDVPPPNIVTPQIRARKLALRPG